MSAGTAPRQKSVYLWQDFIKSAAVDSDAGQTKHIFIIRGLRDAAEPDAVTEKKIHQQNTATGI